MIIAVGNGRVGQLFVLIDHIVMLLSDTFLDLSLKILLDDLIRAFEVFVLNH